MDYRPAPFPPQLAQGPPHPPLRDADLLDGLLLRDQSLLGLGHRQLFFVQLLLLRQETGKPLTTLFFDASLLPKRLAKLYVLTVASGRQGQERNVG
jgi:hypothetical protein